MKDFFARDSLGSFIQNRFVVRNKEKPLKLLSSTTKKPWMKIYPATQEEIKTAIKSAVLAFPKYRKTTAYQRSKILRLVGDALLENKEKLARLITTEMGKTIKESRAEIDYAAGYFHWFSDSSLKVIGQIIPSQYSDKSLRVYYEPVGVSAIITPWNFPIAMAARKIAPALAAGCPVLVKPSPETPVSMLAIAELFQKAGLEKGIFSVLVGDEKLIGEKFLNSKEIRKISFTGSTKVGKMLYAKCAPTLKKATLELGGNAPLLVFDDADLEVAIVETMKAKFRNNGQSCIAVNRILVQKGIYKKFMEKFIREVKKLRVGDPFSKNTDISTVLHAASLERIPKHIADAIKKGAKLVLRGKTSYHPQILTDCKPSMLVFKEETFGPLVAISKFDSEKEGLKMANDTSFGLASYFFTQDLKRAHRVGEGLEFGIIGLNDGIVSTPQVPFGGIKQSGFGREGGDRGIYEYLVEKYISQKL